MAGNLFISFVKFDSGSFQRKRVSVIIAIAVSYNVCFGKLQSSGSLQGKFAKRTESVRSISHEMQAVIYEEKHFVLEPAGILL